jgi:hypothetical protein
VLELAGHARLDGAVLGGDDACGLVCESVKGLPIASPSHYAGRVDCRVSRWKRRARLDLDPARSVALSTPIAPGGQSLVIGIGGQLDVDLVGVDHVIVGDVALGIDDEAGAQRLADTAASALVAVIAPISPWPKKRLKKSWKLPWPSPPPPFWSSSSGFWGLGWGRPENSVRILVAGLLGQRLRVDVHHRRARPWQSSRIRWEPRAN